MKISRRTFFKRTGALAAGAAAIAVLGFPDAPRSIPSPHDVVGSHHNDVFTDCTFDHLVSDSWDGVEGVRMTSLTDNTFRVWRDPQNAIAAAKSGESVFVTPGEYRGPIMARGDVSISIVGSKFT